MVVHGGNDSGEEQKKLFVVIGGGTRSEQVLAGIGHKRPVIVFPGTIYAGEGFLVQETFQIVPACHLLHSLHN